MLRTRVGYTGGTKKDPTYYELGNHAEAIQIDFDPELISYADLLKIFWSDHNPCSRSFSTQYASAVYVHNDEQQKAAEKTRDALPFSKETVVTPIIEATRFYLAEDYHQKYTLRRYDVIAREISNRYPDDLKGFIDSTAAARLNGYLSGKGSKKQFEKELESLGLSDVSKEHLRLRVAAYLSD